MCDSTLTCYTNGIDTEETLPNKHLEHLEDLIFTGRKEALTAVWSALNKPELSVKWDGAPAIVFGTNPANGKFFVGTKSVFNKVKVKICYTQEDIDQYYSATLRTFSVYACVIFLISLELSKGTSLVSAVVLFTVLILLSIGSLPRLVITLSLLHILLTQKYLRMLMLALGLAWSLRLALCF